MTLSIPVLNRPTLKEIQKEWSYIKSIESDSSTEKAVEIEFVSVLKEGESYITGSEYEARLKARTDVILGFQHRKWLIDNQENPVVKEALEALRKEGVWYIDFPGLVVVDEDGSRCVPCAGRDGKRWGGSWSKLAYDFRGNGRFAVSSKLHSNPQTPGTGPSEPLDSLRLERIASALERIANNDERLCEYLVGRKKIKKAKR
jgi:hypothetical protein